MSVQSQQVEQNHQVWQAWQTFWASTLGQEVIATETALLKPVLENARGYHLLLIGSTPAGDLFNEAGIRHHIEWRPSLSLAEKESCLIADPAALPLPDDSMDLVILQHSLELFAKPHALLKEAARVVLAKGELVLIGFNPISLWGLARMLPRFMQAEPLRNLKQANLVRQGKLADWLEFLDLKTESSQQLFHRPPCNRIKIQNQLRALDLKLDQKDWPLAGIYFLRIKKRVGSPLRPTPAWKKTGWMPLQPLSTRTRTSYKNR